MRVHNLLRRCCRLLPRAALLSALILASGCGSKYAKVSGKVLHKGEPLPGGVIVFTPSNPGVNPASAEIDENGNYSIDHVPVGPVMISVSNEHLKEGGQPDPIGIAPPPEKKGGPGKDSKGPPMPMAKGGPPQMPKDAMAKAKEGKNAPTANPRGKPAGKYVKIDQKYSRPETSGLEYTVTSGTQTFDVKLE